MPEIGNVLLDTSVAIAIVALGELLCGIRKSARAPENLSDLQHWLQTVTLLSNTQATADRYAAIKTQLAQAGTPIPENDDWIAAHAMEHGLPLAARDEHFHRIAGLTLLDWR